MSARPVILWDIGNVLVRWDPRNLYRKIFSSPEAMERFLGGICTMEWHGRADAGEAMKDTCAELAARHPAYSSQIHAWRTRWPEMFAGPVDGSVALLEAFAARGVPQYAITNFPAEKWDEFAPRHGWVRHFADIVVSGHEGTRKPDAPIFELFEARSGADPADVVFIDDNADNVAAGAARGYDAILFEGANRLKASLAGRGLV